jgi:hypothetical protein
MALAKRDYTVVEEGFFYGRYYFHGETISLLPGQAKYEELHGSIVDPTKSTGAAAAAADSTTTNAVATASDATSDPATQQSTTPPAADQATSPPPRRIKM